MNKVLFYFTRGFSSGITLLKTVVRSLLPGLYLLNLNKSTKNTILVYDGDYPNISPQAYGDNLDLIGDMFGVKRNLSEEDSEFRRRILFSIGQSPTKMGIIRSVERLLSTYGVEAKVTIRENYKTSFDGVSSTFDVPIRNDSGSLLYGFSIVVEPKMDDASTPILNENGVIVGYKVRVFNFYTFELEDKIYSPGVSWRKYKNLYINRLVDSFRLSSLGALINTISAAGVRVDRVIIKEPGAGGAKGEIYYDS